MFAATSAYAQYYLVPPRNIGPPGYGDFGMPSREILRMVRAQGLAPLTQPARRGPNRYVLMAADRMGGQFHVVVSAHDGRVVRVIPTHDPRFAYNPARPHAMIPNGPPQPQYGAPPSERYGAPPSAQYGAPPSEQYGAPPPRVSSAPPPERDVPPAARAPRTPSAPPPAAHAAREAPRVANTPDSSAPSSEPRALRTPMPRPRPRTAASSNPPASTETRAPAAETQSAPAAPAPERNAAPAPKAAPSTPTQMVPVVPLD
jgi:hypothetical protein